MAGRFVRRLLVVVLLTGLITTAATVAALATHIFSDVPDAAFYHAAVEWIFNRGITAGCAAGLYCPDAAVTRAQMAVFMRNLGVALTPVYLRGQSFGAVDPDVDPVICQSSSFTVTGYPRQAVAAAHVSLAASGAMSVEMGAVYSTDGGTTWDYLPGSDNNHRAGAAGSGQWIHVAHAEGPLNMEVGSSYMFGVRIIRDSGTADAADSRCDVLVEITNRNAATSPLAPRGRITSGDR